MEGISLQTGLMRILPAQTAGEGAGSKESLAQSFDELFTSLLLKELNLAGPDSTGILNDVVRASFAREMAIGQHLGLGRLLVEQYSTASPNLEKIHD